MTTKGDLIQGGATGSQERLPVGVTTGQRLVTLATGKAGWTCGTIALTNKLDAQADAGKLFAIATDCDKAFVTGDALGCGRVYVATADSIGDDCTGVVVYAAGPVRVKSVGQIARGDYLRKSATAGAVQGTCVNMLDHRPIPRGTLGVALSASLNDCVELLLFPFSAPGSQGLATVRGNKSQSNLSSANSVCTKHDMLADALVLRDACNDVVVVTAPASLTQDITVDNGNKDNGRDQSGAFVAGDIHFYWVYEGASGRLKTRSSVVPPCDRSGPTLPACETHWAYSHSAYWNANCLHRVTVRGRTVYYECARNVLNAVTGNCETRTSLVTLVPLAATRVHLNVRHLLPAGGVITDVYRIGYRLNCLAWTVPNGGAGTASNSTMLTLPNVNQEFFYRFEGSATQGELTVDVEGYDVPSGDS